MRLLINGGLPHDSGKTKFGLSLISSMKEVGLEIFPSKPVAGHNAWYSYSTLARSVDMGVLAGNDALAYHDLTGDKVEEINPFAVLLFPVDLDLVQRNFSFYNFVMDRGYPVLVRLTQNNSTYLEGPSGLIVESMKDILERLKEQFNPIQVTEDEIWHIIGKAGELSYLTLLEQLRSKPNVLIESYNNASCPTLIPLELDYAITVVPGRAYVFNGRDYSSFLQLYSRPWLVKAESAFKYLRPMSFHVEVATSRSPNLIDYLIKKVS
ncbi:hypothetical protein [Metallosphaera hakonensis]|uniref:ATPase n=1 Tax=Metallosphaera hakonensis JCM 8857 = DSM 7519 TaxID=1293036 RepID=A0A2U9IUF6_9CREN|nr:hypothetical protein [Metallosphaera hakonensis]AWR99668.1 ATPase [Metallosphaera hakonensis JCM 8857 = DSM 7519]